MIKWIAGGLLVLGMTIGGCVADQPDSDTETDGIGTESDTLPNPMARTAQDPPVDWRAERISRIPAEISSLTTDSLIELLAVTEGTMGGYGNVVGDIDGEKEVVYALIAREESALVPLVDCLTRTDQAAMDWQGSPVMLGHMCAVVMNSMLYYEHYDEYGDVAAWPGHVTPEATPEEMAEAQAAWREVIAEKRHRWM